MGSNSRRYELGRYTEEIGFAAFGERWKKDCMIMLYTYTIERVKLYKDYYNFEHKKNERCR